MKKNDPLIIFGYAFPHRKTYDFLMILFSLGFNNITVIAAPKVKLVHDKGLKKFAELESSSFCVKTLCRTLKIEFIECAHDDPKKISAVNTRIRAKTAIISGACIIKEEVIDIFDNGIVNFHPGMIPETSGLDSFYYSIKKIAHWASQRIL
jgi:methionyl-tRNA formyltransferase